jgi:hypothetical protein
MRTLLLRLVVFLAVAASLALGQVGNGTITGTVTDPAGAVVAGVAVEATNTETSVAYPTVSTNTGNYTITNLPVGTYSVSVKAQGFKTYTHTNLAVAATQILREDVSLLVGASSDSVTVTAEASLLKTETGELSHNVNVQQMDELPLLGIGTANAGTSGVRNPYNLLQTIPGVSSYASSGQFTLNGLGGNMAETMRVEGQDSTSRLFGTYDYTQMGQPSADSIQEVAFQTSNYAAEFGQAGSVAINMTMRSGTNQYHGTGYDYFVNEDLNAGDPFSISGGPGSSYGGSLGKYRPRNRRNDFGGTLGGPVYIPKIYNGRNKTFFFWNYEQFLETTQYGFTDTVPTPAFLKGDFSAISPNGTCSLCSLYGIPTGPLGVPSPQLDAKGRQLFANEIYDPLSRGVLNGLGYADPFPNNVIPLSRLDPSSAKIAALFPAAQNSNLLGNYGANVAGSRYSAIPSIKVDHNLSDKDKLSFFWSRINTESQISSPLGGADGLPLAIGAYRGTFIPTYTTRLNYDRTIKPNLLLHLGGGYYHTIFLDHAPVLNFDPASVGLNGFVIHRQFPSITGLCATTIGVTGCQGYGGMQNLGEAIQTLNYEEKPTFTSNLTWIKGSHTFKFGAELYLEQIYNGSFSTVTLAASAAPTNYGATAQPFTPSVSLNGFTQGFGYANFLLGDYTSTTQAPQENYRQGQQAWGLFLQDSWKVTRRLTLDYGIRWDLMTPYHEQYGRFGQFDPNTPNANAGGHLGATLYANTCNCQFYQPSYPYAVGPRIGVAYQISPKTVFRGGFGVNYQFIGASAGAVVAANGAYPLSGINPFVNIETPGAIVAPSWPVTDPNRYPVAGTVGGFGSTPTMPDANQNRPPRVLQWSIGLQREITRDFVMEASYVANLGVWEQGSAYAVSGPLGFLSQISPAVFAKYGLYPYPGTGPAGYAYKPAGLNCVAGNDCDRALLSQSLNSPAVVSKLAGAGFTNFLPYSGFPATNSLMSALYPFPQFGALAPTGSATGNSKYNSLQVKATKRYSHGFQAGGAFTWAKGFVRPTRQDFFNAQGNPWQLQQIPPLVLTFNATYTVQKADFLPKYINTVTKDWQFGFFANYQSGSFITPPTSPTSNYLISQETLTGQPLYLKDPNSKSTNPYTDVVLNPAAWAACNPNTTCPAASTLYPDFRNPRHPIENANIGRNFRFGKDGKYDLYVRGEFVNIFNRTEFPNFPTTTPNPQAAVQRNGLGILTGGFGVINAYQAPNTATIFTGRTGTLIARFQF